MAIKTGNHNRKGGAGVEALSEAPFDTLTMLLLDTLKKIEWRTGMMQLAEVQEVDDKLEAAWRAAERGEITIDAFKSALAEWERVVQVSHTNP